MVLKRRPSDYNNRNKNPKQRGGNQNKLKAKGRKMPVGVKDSSKRLKIAAKSTANKSYLKGNRFQNKIDDRLKSKKATKGKSTSTTIQRIKSGKDLKLFTKHFDARSKIGSKQVPNSILKNKSGAKGVAKRALDEIRFNARSNIVNEKRNLPKNKVRFENKNPRLQEKITSKKSSLLRKSTFTGKSIQIVAKNDLSMKERKDLVKGKSSMSGGLDSISRVRLKTTPVERPTLIERPLYSDNTKEHYESRYRPVSDSHLASDKKSIPAKVVISNLHPNVTQDDIKELFGAIGELLSARLMTVGTAACVYANAEDAFAAYTKYHTRNLDGQPMLLKITSMDGGTNAASQSSSSSFLRSSNRLSQQQYKQPTNVSSGRGSNNIQQGGGKPVVFTVKL